MITPGQSPQAPDRAPWLARRRRVAGEFVAAAGAGAAIVCEAANLTWLGLPDEVRACLVSDDGSVVGLGSEPDHDARQSQPFMQAMEDVGIRSGDQLIADGARANRLAGAGIGDCSRAFASARQRKDPDEVELIKAAAELVDIGQAVVRRARRPGISEQALWAEARAAVKAVHDSGVEAQVDLMVGPRTAMIGAPPTDACARPGDPVLFDLALERHGYWADSCVTISCGRSSARLRRRYDAIRAAFDRGLQVARPGVSASDLDRVIRAALDGAGLTCPHHTGHGIGTAPQELPWLLPNTHIVLEEGTVITLEPGAYAGGFGVRLEHVLLIETTGATLLTAHSLELT